MLAERVMEWTREWKQEGFQQGIAQGVEVVRAKLLTMLEERFGALPEAARRQVGSISSVEELAELLYRSGTASSLASLGLVKD